MELRHLRYFAVLAEELHFARAGERLGIEQSPLSRQIRDLEADLKVRLFERSRRSTRLTKAGERFLIDARRILADVDLSVRTLRTVASSAPALRVGVAEGLAGEALGRLLKACRDGDLPAEPMVVEGAVSECCRLLEVGGLDVVISAQSLDRPGLESIVAGSEPLVLINSTGQKSGRSAAWLKDQTGAWVLPEATAQPGYAAQIAALLQKKRITIRSHQTAGTPAALTRLVASGAGAGLLPASIALPADDVSLRRLRDTDAVVTIWLTVRRGDASVPVDRIREVTSRQT